MIHQEERKVYDYHCDDCQEELGVGDSIYCRDCMEKIRDHETVSEMGNLVNLLITEVNELKREISSLKNDYGRERIILDHHNLEEWKKNHPEVK